MTIWTFEELQLNLPLPMDKTIYLFIKRIDVIKKQKANDQNE